jgi:nucleoside-diphosphate-sugar epimerase
VGWVVDTFDRATRGTFVLLTSALDAGIRRFVVASTLELFSAVDPGWRVMPSWRPRPHPETAELAAWLAEISAREIGRAPNAAIACVRLGSADAATMTAAVEQALGARSGFSVAHIGKRPARKRPQLASRAPGAIHNVVIFGAGGPLAAATAAELAPHYRLRLTDLNTLAEMAATPRTDQHPDAPRPAVPAAPHEELRVDVTDPAQVLAACAGMDAIVNCTVMRTHTVQAFRVNTLGALNIAQAAVAHGIRRIVQTGPQLHSVSGEADYSADYDIVDDAPPRPGRNLYFHSKYLGQEICRVYADAYGLEIPVLLFSDFVQPDDVRADLYPFSVAWADAARAIRRALEVPSLPSPYEVFTICADLPHGVFSNRKAKQVLGWSPQHDLASSWKDGAA